MPRFTYNAADEAHTAALGTALAEILPDGTTVALCGTLGSGKTRLVQAIAEASGIDRRQVTSPTFVLLQQYEGQRQICHMDAYRLRDEDEFLQLGPEEYFYDRSSLTLVEWADRVQGCLPSERIEVRIEVTGRQSRRFEVLAFGANLAGIIGRLQRKIEPASER